MQVLQVNHDNTVDIRLSNRELVSLSGADDLDPGMEPITNDEHQTLHDEINNLATSLHLLKPVEPSTDPNA